MDMASSKLNYCILKQMWTSYWLMKSANLPATLSLEKRWGDRGLLAEGRRGIINIISSNLGLMKAGSVESGSIDVDAVLCVRYNCFDTLEKLHGGDCCFLRKTVECRKLPLGVFYWEISLPYITFASSM